jgi:hypothetical protein
MQDKSSTSKAYMEIPLLTQTTARTDIVSALAVEIAIAIHYLLGTKIAAQFLRNHKITINIALRVLLRPHERRQYGF